MLCLSRPEILLLLVPLCAACGDGPSAGSPDPEGQKSGVVILDGGFDEDAAGPSRYVNAHDGTVKDTTTGLTWQTEVEDFTMDSKLAASYCKALTLAGQGWRLPSRKELEGLLDRKHWPTIDPVHFPDTFIGYYWTFSQDSHGKVWAVSFDSGDSTALEPSAQIGRTRCVR